MLVSPAKWDFGRTLLSPPPVSFFAPSSTLGLRVDGFPPFSLTRQNSLSKAIHLGQIVSVPGDDSEGLFSCGERALSDFFAVGPSIWLSNFATSERFLSARKANVATQSWTHYSSKSATTNVSHSAKKEQCQKGTIFVHQRAQFSGSAIRARPSQPRTAPRFGRQTWPLQEYFCPSHHPKASTVCVKINHHKCLTIFQQRAFSVRQRTPFSGVATWARLNQP